MLKDRKSSFQKITIGKNFVRSSFLRDFSILFLFFAFIYLRSKQATTGVHTLNRPPHLPPPFSRTCLIRYQPSSSYSHPYRSCGCLSSLLVLTLAGLVFQVIMTGYHLEQVLHTARGFKGFTPPLDHYGLDTTPSTKDNNFQVNICGTGN